MNEYYYNKYISYKNKYLKLKEQLGSLKYEFFLDCFYDDCYILYRLLPRNNNDHVLYRKYYFYTIINFNNSYGGILLPIDRQANDNIKELIKINNHDNFKLWEINYRFSKSNYDFKNDCLMFAQKLSEKSNPNRTRKFKTKVNIKQMKKDNVIMEQDKGIHDRLLYELSLINNKEDKMFGYTYRDNMLIGMYSNEHVCDVQPNVGDAYALIYQPKKEETKQKIKRNNLMNNRNYKIGETFFTELKSDREEDLIKNCRELYPEPDELKRHEDECYESFGVIPYHIGYVIYINKEKNYLLTIEAEANTDLLFPYIGLYRITPNGLDNYNCTDDAGNGVCTWYDKFCKNEYCKTIIMHPINKTEDEIIIDKPSISNEIIKKDNITKLVDYITNFINKLF